MINFFRINTDTVISKVKLLFQDTPHLIKKFQVFLPPGYQFDSTEINQEISTKEPPKQHVYNHAISYVKKVKVSLPEFNEIN